MLSVLKKWVFGAFLQCVEEVVLVFSGLKLSWNSHYWGGFSELLLICVPVGHLKKQTGVFVFCLTNDCVKILFRNVCPWCMYMNVKCMFAEWASSHCFRWIVETSQ